MSKLENEVIRFIKTDRSLAKGKELYNRLPGKSRALQSSFNRMNGTPSDINIVCFELCKAVGISEYKYKVLMQQDVKSISTDTELAKTLNPITPIQKNDSIPDILNINVEDYQMVRSFVKQQVEKGEIEQPVNWKKETLKAVTHGLRKKALEQISIELPKNVKAGIGIRQQFPFLRDQSCPDFLKILVADLITAREKYVAGHQQLWNKLTKEEQASLAQNVVENFMLNKQAFAELDHYREFNEILGEHPSYLPIKYRKEFEVLNAVELGKKQQSLDKNVRRNTTKLEKLPEEDDKRDDLLARIEDYKVQLQIVTEILKTR
ncbi:hypothetical protein JCM19294_1130 [Nonlabens tegetincola]|uniref:Uncharacterized protein n=2 Tax=Nonlabens tegetincola TaxID=323273 RepID=A0A090QMQ9_9FLAO|nr:hypothetical protein JCM19294_1130 [Nonlabens tegetincola]